MKNKKSGCLSYLIKIGLLVFVCYVLFFKVLTITIYHDGSMYPSIRDGDLVIAVKQKGLSLNDVVMYKEGSKVDLGRITDRVISSGEDQYYIVKDSTLGESNGIYKSKKELLGAVVLVVRRRGF